MMVFKFLINDSRLNRQKKIQVGISYFLQLTIILALAYEIYVKEWLHVFAMTGVFFLMLLPSILRRSYIARLPVEIDLTAIIFIYLTVFLGGVQSFYDKFGWYDNVMHTLGGLLFGLLGFLLVYVLNTSEKVHLKLKPFFVVLFSISFANMIAVIWEIFEFSMDHFFGTLMQESSLVDTMWDLIVAEFGALLVAVIAYIYLKKQRHLVEEAIHSFLGWKPLRRLKKLKKRKYLKKVK